MELILLRHGIPIEPEEWSSSDALRPLTPEGRVQTRAVIATLVRAGRLPGFAGGAEIWSSPYVRADQTARIAAEVLGVSVRECRALTSGLELIKSLPRFAAAAWPERLICVGHQPDLSNLISHLTGAPTGRYALGRSGTARLLGDFRPGGMKLEWILTAEEALELEG